MSQESETIIRIERSLKQLQSFKIRQGFHRSIKDLSQGRKDCKNRNITQVYIRREQQRVLYNLILIPL